MNIMMRAMQSQSANTRMLGAATALGLGAVAFSQPPMEPIGATLRYEVAFPGGAWGSSATIQPGERVEWRVVMSYTGTSTAGSLAQVFYQPILSNVDNQGDEIDTLGTWRNGGLSGQGNTTLAQGLLPLSGPGSGEDSNIIPGGYGRVHFGWTSRSTTAGSSGGLVGHRHTAGSAGAPQGSFIRIAGSNNPTWYPQDIPNGSVALNNQILWGVVSDNNMPTSTWFVAGTQNLVLFRHAFIASTDAPDQGARIVTMTSEAASLRRRGGGAGTDDGRFMTWAAPGQTIVTASVRVGVEYIPASITIVPGPSTLVVAGALGLGARRSRRG